MSMDSAGSARSNPPPVVQLVAVTDGEYAPMLAARLTALGCSVEAVCSRTHVLTLSRSIHRCHVLPRFGKLRAVQAAIAGRAPRLVIACDDAARYALAAVYRQTATATAADAASRRVAAILASSLGAPAHFDVLENKSALLKSLAGSDIRLPVSVSVPNEPGLAAATASMPYPFVLKRDRTSGGQGVIICRTAAESTAAYAALSGAATPRDLLRRAVFNAEFAALREFVAPPKAEIVAQSYIDGTPANRIIVAVAGRVLAGLTVRAERTHPEPTGPATVVRIIEHDEITRAVEFMVRRYGISGVCGFDFVLEHGTDHAYFVEANPRATPTVYLGRAPATDVCAAIASHFCGLTADLVDGAVDTADAIPIFPGELRRDLASTAVASPHHQVPWSDPAIVAAFAAASALQTRSGRSSALRNRLAGYVLRRLLRQH